MGSIDRLPHPVNVTLLASAARTATANSSAQTNDSARGVLITFVSTAETGTAEVTPSIDFSYDGGTTWVQYWTAAAAVSTITTATYLLYPGILATADGALTESVNLPLPRLWRLTCTVADTDSFTYAVYAQLL